MPVKEEDAMHQWLLVVVLLFTACGTPPSDPNAPSPTPLLQVDPNRAPGSPIEFRGSGRAATVPIMLPGLQNRLAMTHTGKQYFRVWILQGNEEIGPFPSPHIEADGPYQGMHPYRSLPPYSSADPIHLINWADGDWTIRIEALDYRTPAEAYYQSTAFVN
jgi:hypothetical protein